MITRRRLEHVITALMVAWFVLWVFSLIAFGKDNGQFDKWKSGDATKDFLMHQWFEHLASGKGLCCSFADGTVIEDVDWDTKDGHYRVHLNGEWVVVDDSAVITEPNRFGKAVVWPIFKYNSQDVQQIRCFMPGAGT